MNDELKYLLARTAQGKYNRRAFLGKAGALGITAVAANTMLSSAAHAAGPVRGGTLSIGLGGGESTNSLDPAAATSQVIFNILRQSGENLVNVSPSGEIDFRLAESIESTADAKTWSFKIRKGVEFHNGKTLTPEDVLATLERHSNEESKSGALGIMQGIESMRVDGDSVEVTLTTPNADLPFLMADYHLVIQPNGGMDDPTAGIFTGPYAITVNEPGIRYVGERFANYWDDSIGHFDTVETLVINDATARSAALQSGQVQMINQVDPNVAGLLDRSPGLSVRNVSGRGHYVFIMHCDMAPFDNNDLRLALKYAINREEMVEKILSGYGSIGNDFPINAAYPLFDDTIAQRTYDPEKAAFHYKKSGHDGSPIILRTADGAFPGAVDAAALFQQSAAAAGIPLEIKREPNDGYWSEVWNKQPFCASYWSGRPVQDQMYSTAYTTGADWNDTRFFNDTFDGIVLEARSELDLVKRKALYSEAAMLVRDEGGVICPMFNDFVEGVRDDIAGWEADPNLEMMNGFAAVKCWKA
ncbi:ABC transporter substrate-binding protein [Falsihalocynthiibacter sp. CO-5D18]|uniref:ABC transporter substrate-binding protein n=1 Tax=Falsihalocynthiibacter sp. CO-5D18 TaxID=3240872 RepID=UPI00350F5B0D